MAAYALHHVMCTACFRLEIGGYFMHKDKFSANQEQAGRIVEAAKAAFSDARINTSDGCRFDFEDGWLHLRASNTEPVIRVIIEARDAGAAKKYVDAVSDIRRKVAC